MLDGWLPLCCFICLYTLPLPCLDPFHLAHVLFAVSSHLCMHTLTVLPLSFYHAPAQLMSFLPLLLLCLCLALHTLPHCSWDLGPLLLPPLHCTVCPCCMPALCSPPPSHCPACLYATTPPCHACLPPHAGTCLALPFFRHCCLLCSSQLLLVRPAPQHLPLLIPYPWDCPH